MGLMFYYQDAKNYYKVELDAQYNVFQMVRVVDGIESVVSRTAGRYALNDDIRLRVDVKDHLVDVYLDGEPAPSRTRSRTGPIRAAASRSTTRAALAGLL